MVSLDQTDALRAQVRKCIASRSFPSAAFLADKLVTMTKDTEDVVLLAECYFFTKQYRRAIYLLQSRSLLTFQSKHAKTLLLAAQCHAESAQWEELLEMLGDRGEPVFFRVPAHHHLHQHGDGGGAGGGGGGVSIPGVGGDVDGDRMSSFHFTVGGGRDSTFGGGVGDGDCGGGVALSFSESETRRIARRRSDLDRRAAIDAQLDRSSNNYNSSSSYSNSSALFSGPGDIDASGISVQKKKKARRQNPSTPAAASITTTASTPATASSNITSRAPRTSADAISPSLAFFPGTPPSSASTPPHPSWTRRPSSNMKTPSILPSTNSSSLASASLFSPLSDNKHPSASSTPKGTTTTTTTSTTANSSSNGTTSGNNSSADISLPLRKPGDPPLVVMIDNPTTAANINLVRGKALCALEQRAQSAFWYEEALIADPHCFEAFEALVDGHMLTAEEERALFEKLQWSKGEEWLEILYKCHTKSWQAGPNGAGGGLGGGGGGGGRRSSSGGGERGLDVLEREWSLRDNTAVLACRAKEYFAKSQFTKCLELTNRLLEDDPYNTAPIMSTHVTCLVELRNKPMLFYCAHCLVRVMPSKPVAWYAVGCYYFLIQNYDTARRFLSKATAIDPHYGPAWMAFGHAFAVQGENDQAMAAYRTAERVLVGSYLPPLCIGIELMRVNNAVLAEKCLRRAKELCDTDPLVWSELGQVAYRQGRYKEAVGRFTAALKLLCNSGVFSSSDPDRDVAKVAEPILFNLGHCHRKLNRFNKAITCYKRCLRLSPRNGSTFAALGFTNHLRGRIHEAVEYYHQCLAVRSEDTFVQEMLEYALTELLVQPVDLGIDTSDGDCSLGVERLRVGASPGVRSTGGGRRKGKGRIGAGREMDSSLVTPPSAFRRPGLFRGGASDSGGGDSSVVGESMSSVGDSSIYSEDMSVSMVVEDESQDGGGGDDGGDDGDGGGDDSVEESVDDMSMSMDED